MDIFEQFLECLKIYHDYLGTSHVDLESLADVTTNMIFRIFRGGQL